VLSSCALEDTDVDVSVDAELRTVESSNIGKSFMQFTYIRLK
jgi:hypothetical protein